MSKGNNWTSIHRQQQAQRIQQWRPWERSTGPKTASGKAVSARNSWKGGTRPMLRELAKALREQKHSFSSERQRLSHQQRGNS